MSKKNRKSLLLKKWNSASPNAVRNSLIWICPDLPLPNVHVEWVIGKNKGRNIDGRNVTTFSTLILYFAFYLL